MKYVLSDYRIERVLGQGGFGITYLATDKNLGRQVAIKEYFPREYASRDTTLTVKAAGNTEDRETFKWGLERFLEEAKVLARFDHPNIIAVRRFFRANGTAYLVMDYCEGKPLDELIRQSGSLDRGQLDKLFSPMLDALEVLHRANIFHRDIKPANIYIRLDGSPVLLDFGAARQEIGGHSRSMTSLATQHYAAVEQYTTRGQGPYTDIYSLGATLYRAVTGEKPQDSPDRMLDDKLVPSQKFVGGKFDGRILFAIDVAMKIRPEERPQTVAEWRDQLRAFEVKKTSDPTQTKHITPRAEEWVPLDTAQLPIPGRFAPLYFFLGIAILLVILSFINEAGKPTKEVLAVVPVSSDGKNLLPGEQEQVLQDCVDCPRMALIPAGSFLMGSPDSESGRSDEEGPQHKVTIASSIYVGQYEVTVEEWNACAQDKGCVPIAPNGRVEDQLPVTNVSWFDAQAYVVWLSKKSGNTYRLLSEAEWEYSARASSKESYSFGRDAKKLGDYAWYQENSDEKFQQDGLKKPNQAGLYDMLGNVMEWTQDCWSQNFEGAPSDGKASTQGECTQRVVRGGSYFSNPQALRSAFRNLVDASDRHVNLGFRVARSN